MEFNVQMYSDGRPQKFGNAYGLSLEEAVEELIYYDMISNKYSEEELSERLKEMKVGYTMYGTAWSEIKVTKIK